MSEIGNQNSGDNQQQNSPQNQQQPQSGSNQSGPDWNTFVTMMNALPETIAKSVKEAIGTPKPPEGKKDGTNDDSGKSTGQGGNANANSTGGNDGGKTVATPGKGTGTMSERFAQWWSK